MTINLDSISYLRVCMILGSLGSILLDAELLSLRPFMQNGDWLSPSRRFYRWTKKVRILGGDRSIESTSLVIVLLRVLAAIMILATGRAWWPAAVGVILYILCACLLQVRGGLGNNGSDEMLLVVMIAGGIATLIGTQMAARVALIFLAAQLSLSYATSGAVKLAGKGWRNGSSLLAVMSTRTYGHTSVAALLRRSSPLLKVVSIGCVMWELVAAAGPWLPSTACYVILGVGIIFHASVAYSMGLNTFVLAFWSTYPAALYTSRLVWR